MTLLTQFHIIMSVRVAVRVRPFNQREIDLNSTVCITMKDGTTCLINPKDGAVRDFSFDYSFWSHDEFTTDEAGYNHADEGGHYAD